MLFNKKSNYTELLWMYAYNNKHKLKQKYLNKNNIILQKNLNTQLLNFKFHTNTCVNTYLISSVKNFVNIFIYFHYVNKILYNNLYIILKSKVKKTKLLTCKKLTPTTKTNNILKLL